ncbi:MAG: hypothetical protein RJA70_2424 [Pseudomonadota bacterium]|jgi:hypothetical protein
MKSIVNEYLALLEEQEFSRLLAGGELGQDVELAFAMKMDPQWEKMTSEERALVEEALSKEEVPVGAPMQEVDCETRQGDSGVPRKAA